MGWSIHHPVGLIYHSPMLSYKGYTLVSSNTADFAVLVDMEGRICHRWEYHGGIAYGKVLLNGNLLVRTSPDPDYEETRGLGGGSASLVELDWNSVKVWEYDDPALHHDYERLLNGNTIYLRWEPMPADLSARVRGGYRTPEDPINVLGDTIREVSPDGETVAEWRTWENLSVEEDVICPLEGRREWTHANALSSTKEGDFLVSYRQTDTVAIFSRGTGEATWKWGPGEISHQHNARQLDSGNIMIFDNHTHARGGGRGSRIIEVNQESNEIEWTYEGRPPVSFYSSYISGADRSPNGNTLICEGAHGRIFEVTQDGDIVWEYVNPFFEPDREGRNPSNATFRAHRYPTEFPGFTNRDLNPARYANLNRTLGLM